MQNAAIECEHHVQSMLGNHTNAAWNQSSAWTAIASLVAAAHLIKLVTTCLGRSSVMRDLLAQVEHTVIASVYFCSSKQRHQFGVMLKIRRHMTSGCSVTRLPAQAYLSCCAVFFLVKDLLSFFAGLPSRLFVKVCQI